MRLVNRENRRIFSDEFTRYVCVERYRGLLVSFK